MLQLFLGKRLKALLASGDIAAKAPGVIGVSIQVLCCCLVPVHPETPSSVAKFWTVEDRAEEVRCRVQVQFGVAVQKLFNWLPEATRNEGKAYNISHQLITKGVIWEIFNDWI